MSIDRTTGEFEEFPKIARLARQTVVTEKIDGTNAQLLIEDTGLQSFPNIVHNTVVRYVEHEGTYHAIRAGSRSRWLFETKAGDNHGFAAWVSMNAHELVRLGVGRHFGEWWGRSIGRGYGLAEKRFSLFNVSRWGSERPACCHVVPTLWYGIFDQRAIENVLTDLQDGGSVAAPGFMKPEGIVVFHGAANQLFKKTIEGDERPNNSLEAA